MRPLLSVIIPTFNRRTLLKRAIASGLSAAPPNRVEIIVVPNGPDESWKKIAEQFAHDERIQWHYIARGHACSARNHGLQIATGTYIRFLDDDDFLYPSAAIQLEELCKSGADVSSAPLEQIGVKKTPQVINPLPASNDFTSAALLSTRVSLCQGSVFLRTKISGVMWREDAVLYDDYLWILGLAAKTPTWRRFHEPVGAYVDHAGRRLSQTMRTKRNSAQIIGAISSLYQQLDTELLLTPERARAVSTALLTHSHSSFPASPHLLTRAIRTARHIDPKARPLQPLFSNAEILSKNLIAFEWATLIPRILTRSARRTLWTTRIILARLGSKLAQLLRNDD